MAHANETDGKSVVDFRVVSVTNLMHRCEGPDAKVCLHLRIGADERQTGYVAADVAQHSGFEAEEAQQWNIDRQEERVQGAIFLQSQTGDRCLAKFSVGVPEEVSGMICGAVQLTEVEGQAALPSMEAMYTASCRAQGPRHDIAPVADGPGEMVHGVTNAEMHVEGRRQRDRGTEGNPRSVRWSDNDAMAAVALSGADLSTVPSDNFPLRPSPNGNNPMTMDCANASPSLWLPSGKNANYRSLGNVSPLLSNSLCNQLFDSDGQSQPPPLPEGVIECPATQSTLEPLEQPSVHAPFPMADEIFERYLMGGADVASELDTILVAMESCPDGPFGRQHQSKRRGEEGEEEDNGCEAAGRDSFAMSNGNSDVATMDDLPPLPLGRMQSVPVANCGLVGSLEAPPCGPTHIFPAPKFRSRSAPAAHANLDIANFQLAMGGSASGGRALDGMHRDEKDEPCWGGLSSVSLKQNDSGGDAMEKEEIGATGGIGTKIGGQALHEDNTPLDDNDAMPTRAPIGQQHLSKLRGESSVMPSHAAATEILEKSTNTKGPSGKEACGHVSMYTDVDKVPRSKLVDAVNIGTVNRAPPTIRHRGKDTVADGMLRAANSEITASAAPDMENVAHWVVGMRESLKASLEDAEEKSDHLPKLQKQRQQDASHDMDNNDDSYIAVTLHPTAQHNPEESAPLPRRAKSTADALADDRARFEYLKESDVAPRRKTDAELLPGMWREWLQGEGARQPRAMGNGMAMSPPETGEMVERIELMDAIADNEELSKALHRATEIFAAERRTSRVLLEEAKMLATTLENMEDTVAIQAGVELGLVATQTASLVGGLVPEDEGHKDEGVIMEDLAVMGKMGSDEYDEQAAQTATEGMASQPERPDILSKLDHMQTLHEASENLRILHTIHVAHGDLQERNRKLYESLKQCRGYIGDQRNDLRGKVSDSPLLRARRTLGRLFGS